MLLFENNFLKYNMLTNYIYLYHIDKLIKLPSIPQTVGNTMPVSFSPVNVMGRSLPYYVYSNSGPRSMTISVSFHRDMMNMINTDRDFVKLESSDDYVDWLIRQIQLLAVPSYNSAQKMINPPIVLVRFGDDAFIKGVITGSVVFNKNLPLLETGKYAVIDLTFTVNEYEPYSAEEVSEVGDRRGYDNATKNLLNTKLDTALRGFRYIFKK